MGDGPYRPEIDPKNFVEGIDNPYWPAIPGTTWIYEVETDEGLERIVVTVTDETREILGVECTVVRDTVTIAGEVVEDTFDWYAQDNDGNVWYFGELSFTLEDGEIVALEGSWESGVDDAQPGFIMPGNPTPGHVYRQEYLIGEAEDVGAILAVGVDVDIELGSFADCVQTRDTLPFDPDTVEHKFYAPGVGLILETKPNEKDGERLELVEFIQP